ncbi:HAMP domain-containing histidine kinase [Paenibacillus sediminis]|uniref:Signal transduction histidine-protein kinase ArlS n=1 Tax=Paenibacillus sediminis TaxID=664909 RepID=A0ABS4H0X4_9BACL|nr:HAMP domain-containing histidine kinase [Paenibacillus sediminis]MBP1936173.1 two-component system sensor histidine kinase ArlS [Paenibacillus sediminis]
MNRVKLIFSHLPIRWKLAVWASLLLCILFLLYNGVQYLVINKWMMNQEENAITKNMDAIQGYFKQKDETAEEIPNSRSFIEDINQTHQMIRILDDKGTPILTVSDNLPDTWVRPQVAHSTRMISAWHLEDHLLILRSPLILNHFTGTIEIVNDLEITDRLSDVLLAVMFAGGVGAILLSALGGIFLSKQLIRPIQSITDTMIKIKQKGLQERVHFLDNSDELSNLAKVFNDLMDQLEVSFQQQKQFVEDASHELRTPISILEGHISLLNRWGKYKPEILEESLSVSSQELQRLKGIVNELLELTRAEAETPNTAVPSINISETIQYNLTNFAKLYPEFVFKQDLEQIIEVHVRIVPQHLEQILVILLDNAVKYSVHEKEIKVAGFVKGDRVWIQVIDKGIGIPQEAIPYIFDRFYRVDKARSREQGGTGLGLAIAKRLVRRYNGEIDVISTENVGTTVMIGFPIQ